MNASLRTLLSGVVDYAGLFPPANLPLDQAIRNYARHRQEADAWMLGRFVVPATRLAEFDAYADLFYHRPPFRFSLLGRGGDDAAAFLNGLDRDVKEATDFADKHVRRVLPDLLEIRLAAAYNFRLIPLTSESLGPLGWGVFVEGPLDAGGEEPLLETLRRIAAVSEESLETAYRLAPTGYKLRCGGLEASAFPTVDQVASVLAACRDAGVPLKFTAGLHHPIRRFDAGLQTHMHGFVNVFTAGVLAHARRLPEDALRALIADEDPADFVFTNDGLRWRDVQASNEEIAVARRNFVTSFGSCSFDEPRDDLRALGWL